MHQFQPYTDLRLNTDAHQSDTSLWPSFTDIMTVILMIFMLTMIAVIIKNSDLARKVLQLKSSNQEIQKKFDSSEERLKRLNIAITDLEEKIRAKEMEIILVGDEKKMLESSLETKLSLISALQVKVKELNIGVEDLEKELVLKLTEQEALEQANRDKQSEYENKIAAISRETKALMEEFNQKFAALSSRLNRKEEVILVLNSEKNDLELSLARQRKDYSLLEDKYNKLIRPSRSPLGKQVVSVQYSKKGSQYRILFKGPGPGNFIETDRKGLHRQLGGLKKALGDKLYVKIIIPEKSGLTYNEAWGFTKNILSRYDYYYQEKE